MKTAVLTQAVPEIIRNGNVMEIVIPENFHGTQPIELTLSDPEISLKIHIADNANVHIRNISKSQGTINHSLVSHIKGSGSTCDIDWIFHAKGDAKYNLSAKTIFSAPDCKGKIRVRGVAQDSAHAKFDGMIEVTEEGKGTDTYLSLETLMLDQTAKIDAVPALEIRNDSVRAGHSASVTNVSKEDLFYFASRGIGEEAARGMLVEGFLYNI